jgi:putative transposase
LARVHKRITNRRKDHPFKLDRELARQYDRLFFEDLNLKAMQKLLGKKISDLGFGQFMGIHEHVASEHRALTGKIDRFYPSSKECHVCGHVHRDLSLENREWDCPNCGVHDHRDHNAAINILKVGASTHGGEDVRPFSMAAPV